MADSPVDATGTKATTPHEPDRVDQTAEKASERDVASNLGERILDSEDREPEEALETHEVVELNKFTTKKEWIEEKIKLLESLPPVNVFAAVETLTAMSEEIPPELPTRAQLDHWLEEHDKTEKETEIFDAEDMSKLKKLTKAATQRNLSPEDTDLIELTLTTLLALDKLLHLLRDRSEMLDLLGLRLTWEEQRVAAWKGRSSILNDLHSFLATRARWSPDTYEFAPSSTPSLAPALRFRSPSPSPPSQPSPVPSKRRDSTASLTSISSDTSISAGFSSTFSRSTRYKLAEQLSHDAALFSGRLTALNHGKITPAGKTLDRLIDASRIPVPDKILDEQDRLEDKGIKEIEHIGKFAMTVVTQWKRADEHFNDSRKDQATAQALIAEVDSAMLHHPTARHAAAFMSRAQALGKRLAVKADPALPRSSFPRPVHPLFTDQGASNEAIVKTLSMELAEATKLANEAESISIAYHAGSEFVKQAELLRDQMRSIDEEIEELLKSLVQGVHDDHGHGDGSPLDLNKETCLDPTRHATYLALLPSMVQKLESANRASEIALCEGRRVLPYLKKLPGVDSKLSQELGGVMGILENRRNTANSARETVFAQVQRLKEARRLWCFLLDMLRSLEDLKQDAVDRMESHRWQHHEDRGGTPLTPGSDTSTTSSHSPSSTPLSPGMLLQQLDALEKRLTTEFKVPLSAIAKTLELPLHTHLRLSLEGMCKHIDDMRRAARVWNCILRQSENMLALERETHDLASKIDSTQAAIEDAQHNVLGGNLDFDQTAELVASFKDQASVLQASVRSFTDSLALRVPFIAPMDETTVMYTRSNSVSTFSSSNDQRLNSLKEPQGLTLPFDLSALDNGVRADVNAFALRIAGGMQTVDKKLDYLHLARFAKITDAALESLRQDVKDSERRLSDIEAFFQSIMQENPDLYVNSPRDLSSAQEQVDSLIQDHRSRTSRSIASVRQVLDTLLAGRGAHDSPIHGTLIVPRAKSADEAFRNADSVYEACSQLMTRIAEAERQENLRLHMEEERREMEERARLEKDRLEAEKQAMLENERIEMEKMEREERERQESEIKARLDVSSGHQQESLDLEAQAMFEQQRSVTGGAVGDALPEVELNGAQVEEPKKNSRGTMHQISTKEPDSFEEDVFGLRLAPSTSPDTVLSREMLSLRARIMSLRSRLRSITSSALVRSSHAAHENLHVALPSSRQALDVQSSFSAVVADATALPSSVEEGSIDANLKSLRSEVHSARGLLQRIYQLGQFADKVTACDHALSDLLEHADSYPAAPLLNQLTSTHVSDARLPCEEQLANRLTFTKHIVGEMSQLAAALTDDPRVDTEERRLQQASTELADMCRDRINGSCSRPTSSISSAGRSSAGAAQRNPKLSLNPSSHHHPTAPDGTGRRTTSAAHNPIPRPSTHLSNRSVSGPSGFSSLFSSTFASRQRTTSLASIQSATTTPMKRSLSPVTRPRTVFKRPGSPTFSEVSSHSLAATPSRPTWSRASRQSFGTIPRGSQLPDKTPKRKAYVANPKSKLDIAIGNVVNNFRVPVAIQAVDDGWKDLSGKYWIGEVEPKLCFCRILRSQTVMVRVGGGWCELSKFLKGHFAELLAELPPSPPRKEARWITSATVLEASEALTTIPRGLKTPEPQGSTPLPVLQLSTPNGASPRSMRTTSSQGSSPNLTPFQFMRKADAGSLTVTPSPSKSARITSIIPNVAVTPARTNVWRP